MPNKEKDLEAKVEKESQKDSEVPTINDSFKKDYDKINYRRLQVSSREYPIQKIM